MVPGGLPCASLYAETRSASHTPRRHHRAAPPAPGFGRSCRSGDRHDRPDRLAQLVEHGDDNTSQPPEALVGREGRFVDDQGEAAGPGPGRGGVFAKLIVGLGQVFELVTQLRGEAGERQVARHSLGLAQNLGGSGATAVVTILGVA